MTGFERFSAPPEPRGRPRSSNVRRLAGIVVFFVLAASAALIVGGPASAQDLLYAWRAVEAERADEAKRADETKRAGETRRADESWRSAPSSPRQSPSPGWSERPVSARSSLQNDRLYNLQVAAIINDVRAQNRLRPFLPDEALAEAAAAVAASLVYRSRSVRSGETDIKLETFLEERRDVWDRLVQGLQSFGNVEPQQLVDIFLDTPANRRLILHPEHARVGVGSKAADDEHRFVVVLLSTPVIDADAYCREIFRLVNEVRRDNGLNPVAWNEQAAAAARIRARETEVVFAHQRPDGRDWLTVLSEVSVLARMGGENLSKGFLNPAEIMEGFMNSPPHRAVILKADFTQLGIGGLVSRSGQFNCAQIFLRLMIDR
ncbi:MAG: CAP domain-containing protein [Deltaproteobacteria bacterium]|nr:CAP domain-containing protein [Deltaproteobacteria bacterium]